MIIIKTKVSRKPFMIAVAVVLGLGLVGLIIFFLNSQTYFGQSMRITSLQEFIASNPFLNKIFNAYSMFL